jgi:hypothetical protein
LDPRLYRERNTNLGSLYALKVGGIEFVAQVVIVKNLLSFGALLTLFLDNLHRVYLVSAGASFSKDANSGSHTVEDNFLQDFAENA